jgi:putative transposase
MWRPKKKPKAETGKLLQKAHKYLAEPTELQAYRMENWFGSLCRLGNECIAERKDSYRNTGKGLTYTDQQKALPSKRKKDPALCRVHSQVAQDCLQRVDKAFQKFFDEVKAKKSGKKVNIGYPRFKKLDQYKSFTFPQVWMTVKDKKTEVRKRLEMVKFRAVPASKPGGKVKFAGAADKAVSLAR